MAPDIANTTHQASREAFWRDAMAESRRRIRAYHARLPAGVVSREEFIADVVGELYVRCPDSLAWSSNLLSVCRETARQHVTIRRHEWPDDARVEHQPDGRDDSDGEWEEGCVGAVAMRALDDLPHNQRYTIILGCLYNAPDDLIAEVLGCAVTTVRVHRWRALRALRKAIAAV